MRKQKIRFSEKTRKQKALWICLGVLLLLVILFAILLACGVFRSKDDSTASVQSGTMISVPTEIENEKTGGVMRYSYNLQERSLTIRVNGNVEVPFCFPFLPNRDTMRQNLSFIAFNCFDYSPAVILSFSPMILSGKVETVYFEGSMTWDPITYRFQVDESHRVSQCMVDQSGSTTTLIYDYDSNGRLLSVGDQNSYTFDITYRPDSGRTAARISGSAGSAASVGSIEKINILNRSTSIENTLEFNSSGQLTKLTYRGIKTGNTIVAEYSYHRNGMVRTEDVVNIHNRFSYAPDGLLTHPKYNGKTIVVEYAQI